MGAPRRGAIRVRTETPVCAPDSAWAQTAPNVRLRSPLVGRLGAPPMPGTAPFWHGFTPKSGVWHGFCALGTGLGARTREVE